MDRVNLFEFLTKSFDEEELQTLCFKLNIDFDSLSGSNKLAKMRELIELVERTNKEAELVRQIRKERPEFAYSFSRSTEFFAAPSPRTSDNGVKIAVIGGAFTLLATLLGVLLPRYIQGEQASGSAGSATATVISPSPIVATIVVEPTAVKEQPQPTATQTVASDIPVITTQTPSPQASPRYYDFQSCTAPCDGSNASKLFAEKTTKIYTKWSYEQIPFGASYVRAWSQNGKEWIRYQCKWDGQESGTDEVVLRDPKGLRSGVWQLVIQVNGRVLLKELVTVEGNYRYWNPDGTHDKCRD